METAGFPAVDERAVEPEIGTEMIRGEVRRVLPAEPPHAMLQCQIASVMRASVAPGYVTAIELLTRADHDWDFAMDVCVRREGVNAETGSRYLEELSFEIQHAQSEADIEERARVLARRGVRRVFVIPVKERAGGEVEARPVREWLRDEGRWLEWHPSAQIEDACLVTPLKVQALLDADEANGQMTRALLVKQNPVLIEHVQREAQLRALSEAHAREMQEREKAHARETILEFCEVLGIEVTAERQARLAAMTGDELASLRSAIRTDRRWPPGR